METTQYGTPRIFDELPRLCWKCSVCVDSERFGASGKKGNFIFISRTDGDAEWNSHSFHDGWDVLPPLTVSLL